jgi:hypothetical protein
MGFVSLPSVAPELITDLLITFRLEALPLSHYVEKNGSLGRKFIPLFGGAWGTPIWALLWVLEPATPPGVEVAPTSAGGVVSVAGIAVARGVAAAVELSLFCV